jgi:hypothetical protein
LTESKSFTIEKGTLELEKNSSYYFSCVTGGVLKMLEMKLDLKNDPETIIYLEGGTVIFEYLQINESSWIDSLLYVRNNVSSTIIQLISCNITNCNYSSNSYTSAIVYLTNITSSVYPSTLNISYSFFINNSFSLRSDNKYGGAVYFYNRIDTSSFSFIYFFISLFLFFLRFSCYW